MIIDGNLVADLFVPGVSIVEKIVRTIIVHFFLIILIRISGRRQTSQLNSFDLGSSYSC